MVPQIAITGCLWTIPNLTYFYPLIAYVSRLLVDHA
jgi:hypothetical protein